MANLNSKKKYHYTYKVTNHVNDRYYLGMHSTNNLDDGYMGSGHRLRYEIKKYGKSNFSIEILNYYDTRDELINAERELISEIELSDKNCLNLKGGGSGGFSKADSIKGNKKAVKILKENRKDSEWMDMYSKSLSDGLKEAHKRGTVKSISEHFSWKGKTRSEEQKRKIGEANSKYQSGKGNSQYGTRWIYNEKLRENKKINKNSKLPDGWEYGRKLEYYK